MGTDMPVFNFHGIDITIVTNEEIKRELKNYMFHVLSSREPKLSDHELDPYIDDLVEKYMKILNNRRFMRT